MKLLSLAILGLGGIALAGSASAACPSSPDAWSSKLTLGGGNLAIASGGLDSSACKLNASFNAGAGGFASALVRDDSPSNEPQYRFQFLIDTDALNSMSGFQAVQVFTANSAAQYPAVSGHLQILRISIIPGGSTGKRLSFVAACDNGSDNVCTGTPVDLPAGVDRVEGQIIMGGSGTGTIKWWVNNTTEGSPTGTLSVNNAGWSGVDAALMGLAASTSSFRSNQANKIVSFDTFDSRRQTFIGG